LDLVLTHSSNNLVALGAPIGSKEFCEEYCRSKFTKSSEIMEAICQLNNHQIELILLRYCYSFCKVVYLTRTVPLYLIDEFIKSFDDTVLASFKRVIGCDLSADEIEQSRLAIKYGGFGLRAGLVHAEAAYANSIGNYKNTKVDQQKVLSDKIDQDINRDWLMKETRTANSDWKASYRINVVSGYLASQSTVRILILIIALSGCC